MEFSGMSINEALFLLAVLLIVVDFFVSSDILTHIAYLVLAYLIATTVELALPYQLLIGVVAWFVIVACHYTIWRSLVQHFLHAYVAPQRYRSGIEGLIGVTGRLRDIEGRRMVEVQGDVWPCEGADALSAGSSVIVTNTRNGVLVVVQK